MTLNLNEEDELGSLVAALGPTVKKFLTTKNSDGVSRAQNLFKKGTTLLMNRKNAAPAQKMTSVRVQPSPQQELKSHFETMLQPQQTEFVPEPKPKQTPQIRQMPQPGNNPWIALGIGASVVAVLGVTYAITRQRPDAPLSGLPVEGSKDRQTKNLVTD